MRVGCGRKWNSLGEREFDDPIARIEFLYRFAPAGGGKFDRKIARVDEIERFGRERFNIGVRTMAVNLDQVQMCETIDEPGRGNFAHAAKVIRVDGVDVAIDKLRRARRHAVEHLIVAFEVMNGTENKIEPVPIFFDPLASRC